MESFEQSRFEQENESATEQFIKAEKYGALSSPTNELIATIAISAVLVYGGYSVIEGSRTQGDFMAFITAMLLMYEPLKRFSRLNNTIQTGLAAAGRIFAVLDLEPDIREASKPRTLSATNPGVTFEGVTFDYREARDAAAIGDDEDKSTLLIEDEDSPVAISDISLEINSGETVALVGESGSGKSTLANLLPRFYDPQQGCVRIDSVDIRKFSLHSLRSHIALVDQRTFLFDASIGDNIRYGRTDASLEEVKSAAESANAARFVESLPRGYDTMIGEQGLRLSGGQRARIAIARALLQDAPILILDEATASLDSESERLVQEAIDRLMLGRTVLVIAHRLATVRHADQDSGTFQGQNY